MGRSSIKLATILSAVFVVVTMYFTSPGSSLFSWHPTLMALAFGFLMPQGIISLSKNGLLVAEKRDTKINLHWFFQFTGLVSALIASVIIYNLKSDMGKPHLQTWHAQIGFAVLVWFATQNSAGYLVRYPKYVKSFIKPAFLRMAHGFSGSVMLATASLVVVLGLQSDWAVDAIPIYFRIGLSACLLWSNLTVVKETVGGLIKNKS